VSKLPQKPGCPRCRRDIDVGADAYGTTNALQIGNWANEVNARKLGSKWAVEVVKILESNRLRKFVKILVKFGYHKLSKCCVKTVKFFRSKLPGW
jgi:hypothetical protein